MSKYHLRQKARKLRRKGISVKSIASLLGISKGTARIWVRDIILNVEQLQKLRESELKGKELGRLKGALIQKERRFNLIEESKRKGIAELAHLSEREILIAGLALYWGEGSKTGREIEFV